MRQQIRSLMVLTALFLFPVTLNYFSPYVSVDGMFNGIISGSVLVFLSMLVSAIVFRRSWCGWLCPVAGLSKTAALVNNRPVNRQQLSRIRYTIFTLWVVALIGGFLIAGGIKLLDPFYLTESIISVDQPIKYLTYYLVLFTFFGLSVIIGRRAACHSICWMSPILVLGSQIGKWLKIPQLVVIADPTLCINCRKCDQHCPMSIDVSVQQQTGKISSNDCIQCAACVDSCPKKVLTLKVH
jgi:ferredoxin-type protein NapH